MPQDDIVFQVKLKLDQFMGASRTAARTMQQLGQNGLKTTKAIQNLGVTFQSAARGGGQFQSMVARAGQTGRQFISTSEVINRLLKQNRQAMSALGVTADRSSIKVQKAGLRVTKAEQRRTKAIKEGEEAIKNAKGTSEDFTEELQNMENADRELVIAKQELVVALQEQAQAQAKVRASQPSGFQNLVGGFKQVGSSISLVTGVLGKFIAALGIAKIAGGILSGTLGLLRKAFNLLTAPIRLAVGWFTRLFNTALAVAFGVIIRDTIRNIIRNLKDLVVGANDAIKTFQTLRLRLESFENRLIRMVDPTLSFEDAMGQAQERAQGLIEVIKGLSLRIPFSTEVIGNTLSLNLAMGFTERQAISLTESIAAFTAGMGLSSEIMERIVFNFGQMKQAGKVTGTELRDLARGAFLPIYEILGETNKAMELTNQTIAETKRLAGEGKIPIQAFFEAFETVVAKNFPDALDRFSDTIQGVQIRFANFMKTIVGLEILGPIANRATKLAASALDRILVPSVQRAAKLMGEALGLAFDNLVATIRGTLIPALKDLWTSFGFGEASIEGVIRFISVRVTAFLIFLRKGIERVSKWIQGMADNNENTLKTHAENAFAWGYNIIVMLARGMVAAVKFVIKAITIVAGVIASLLRAFSPPKILPDLPKWGMQAMAEYLRGFTLVDYDILKGIQDPVKSALDILEDTGKIGENQAGKLYAQISKAIAQALSTGKITEDLFANIDKITGPFGKEIAILARRQVALAAATRAVQEAEEQLERARKAHEAARVKTNRLIREYNDQLRKGADPGFLKAKLAEINATEKSAQAAYKEQKAAEENLETKESQLDAAEELFRLQKELVNQLIELTRAQIVQPEAFEEAKGAGEEAVEDLAQTWEDVFADLPTVGDPEFTSDLNDILAEAELLAQQWAEKMDQFWEDIGFTDLTEDIANLQAALDDLALAWGTGGVVDRIAEDFQIAKLAVEAFGRTFAEIFGLGGVGEGVARGEIPIVKITGAPQLEAGGGLGGIVTAFSALLTGGLISGLAQLSGLLTGIRDVVASIAESVTTIQTSWDAIKESFGILGEALNAPADAPESWTNLWKTATTETPKLNEQIDKIIESGEKLSPRGMITTLFEGYADGVRTYFDELGVDVPAGVDLMLISIETLLTSKKTDILGPIDDLVIAWVEYFTGMSGDTDAVMEDFVNVFLERLAFMKRESVGNSIIPDMMNAMVDIITTGLNDSQSVWDEKLQAMHDFLFDNFVTPVQEAIDGTLTTFNNYIRDKLGPTLEWLTINILDPLTEGWETVNGVLATFAGLIEDAWAALQKIPGNIIDWLIGHSPSPLAIGISSISDAIANLAKNAVPQMEAATASAPVTYTGANNSVNVNMGGVTVANGMDEVLFEQAVLNVVERALRI